MLSGTPVYYGYITESSISSLQIGRGDNGNFNGSIDEVMIFNRSLNLAEVAALYNATNNKYANNFTGLADGAHTFTSYTVDEAGNRNQTETRTVTVDATVPIVGLINPVNASNYSTVPINFNITTSENASAIFTLTDGLTNYTMTSINETYHGATNGTIADGRYLVKFFVNDTSGNYNNTLSSVFLIDRVVPLVFYGTNTETNGSIVARNNIFVNATASDGTAGVKNITLRLYNASALINTSESDLPSFSMNFTGLSDGLYYFNSTSCDYSNNCNNTATRSVSIDTTTPLAFYGTSTDSDGTAVTRDNIFVNVTGSDTNLANITIRLYNATALLYTNVSNLSSYSVNYTGLSTGAYYFNATVIDLVGNVNNTATRNVNVSLFDLLACGRVLDVANGVYNLTVNVTTTGTCFTISANNVTLLGSGYTITGDGGAGDYGVTTSGAVNATIKSINIASFGAGINLVSTNNSVVADSSIVSSSAGIQISEGAANIVLLNNNITGSTSYTINDLSGSGNNNHLIYNNSFGEIRWTNSTFIDNMTITAQDIVLGNAVIIANNSLYVNTSIVSLNLSSNITLYGLAFTGKYPAKLHRVAKSGAYCSDCGAYGSLIGATARFNVTSAENYSLAKIVRSQSNVTLETGWNAISIKTQTNYTSGENVTITLQPGFNLIGYSADVNVTQSNVEFKDFDDGQRKSLSTAVTQRKIRKNFAYFDASPEERKYKYAPISDSNLRGNKAYWVYVDSNATTGGNLTIPAAGGSLTNETYKWNELMFTNGSAELNITDAFNSRWFNSSSINGLLYYWDTDTGGFEPVLSTANLNSWKGYFMKTNVSGNVTLLRVD